jgi:serine/threonine-protein kinase
VIDIGSVVNGKYRLVRLLGEGGMGSVYEAQHAVLGTRVAIKVLHPELGRRTGLVERFLQEARVAAQIRSAHVVQVTDVDRTSDGHAYIVMELLEGEPLSTILDRQHRLPVPTAGEYTLQILEALEAAHALGVIHRDLKPENVFVTFASGKPTLKLIDFGIAKARRTDPQQRNLTVAGVVMGTAEYMAPEQARSADKVDARSDLYAVGVMLYEMIAGSRPVTGEDARIIAMRVERGEIVPLVKVAPEVPREVAGLVHRAMAARPELRFATATEMRIALENAIAGRRGSLASLPGTPQPVVASQGPMAPQAAHAEISGSGTIRNLPAVSVVQAARGTAAGQTPVGLEHSETAPRTQRAPPIATALVGGPSPYAAPVGVPSAPAVSDPRARRGNKTWALVALPLLLGAGIVGVLIATGAWVPAGAGDGPAPSPAPQALAQEAGASSSTLGVVAPTVPTLSPGVPTLQPAHPVGPTPAVHPSSGHSAQTNPGAAADAGAPNSVPPPFVFPSTLPTALPSFPGVIPLPSGFPPFPSVLPAWPPPPAQGAPSAASSAREGPAGEAPRPTGPAGEGPRPTGPGY